MLSSCKAPLQTKPLLPHYRDGEYFGGHNGRPFGGTHHVPKEIRESQNINNSESF